MSQKIINTDDLAFLLYEMLDIERFTQFPRYEDHSRDTFDAAIAGAEGRERDLCTAQPPVR